MKIPYLILGAFSAIAILSSSPLHAGDSEISFKLELGSGGSKMKSLYLGKRYATPGNEFQALQLVLSTRNLTQNSATYYHLDPVDEDAETYIVSDIETVYFGAPGAKANSIGFSKEEGMYFGKNNRYYFSVQYGLRVSQVDDGIEDQVFSELDFGGNMGMIFKAGRRLRLDGGLGCGLIQGFGLDHYDDKVEQCSISINALFK